MQSQAAVRQISCYEETKSRKMAFLRKAYLAFFFSLISAGIGAYVGLQPSFLKVVAARQWAFLILEILVLFAAWACRTVPGLNLLVLFGFTFMSGLTLAPFFALYLLDSKVALIQEALLLTGVLFLGLTVYVFVTKKDFSFLGGFIFMGLFGLIGAGFLFVFFPPGGIAYTIYCALGALVFCGYILFDTSKLLQGWETNDYIGFAISLYLDFINLFLYILHLLTVRNRE